MNGIMKYINLIARSNEVVYANRLRGYGITQSQHPYILLICREPGIPQEKISREICVNKSSVTRQITILEEKGLIVRTLEQSRTITEAAEKLKLTRQALQYKMMKYHLNT